MSISRPVAGEVKSAFAWLPGYDRDIDLPDVLEKWRHLPDALESGRSVQCAHAYLHHLRELRGPAGGPLLLGSVQAGAETWLTGLAQQKWDSEFFGFEIGSIYPLVSPETLEINDACLAVGSDLVGACVRLARKSGLKQLSATSDSSDTLSQLALENNRFRLRDSLVYFQLNLEQFAVADRDPAIHAITESEVESVAAFAAECFGNRRYNINRFNSDPQFPQQRVRDLYAESIRNSHLKVIADHVLVIEQEGRPVGFATMSLPSERERQLGVNRGKIPLNAVHPDYHGRGLYSRLVKGALSWFKDQEVASVEISTQLPNVAVHRTWQKLGASLVKSCHRFHLNLTAP